LTLGLATGLALPAGAQTNWASTNAMSLPGQPLSLVESLNLAMDHNRALREAKQDLEVARGVVMQTHAILIPHVKARGSYSRDDVAVFSSTTSGLPVPDHLWNGSVRVVQSIYEGGRMVAAYRSAKWTTQQAVDQYRSRLAGVLRDVRLAYYNVLLARSQRAVLEETVRLLDKQAAEEQSRLDAGTSLSVDVARAESELARLRAKLVMAKNQLWVAETRLLDLLGSKLPTDGAPEAPLQLSDGFQTPPAEVELASAVRQALANRPELKVLENTIKLSGEEVRTARANSLPSAQVFGGYGGMNDPIDRDLKGWFAGVQMDWEIFDGLAARGKVRQARAVQEKNRISLENLQQQVEIEVRIAVADLGAAREVIESLRKAQAHAEEALRLTRLRLQTGTATSLDALAAQVALMETQASAIEALYRYNAALTQLEFSTAANLPPN